MRVSTVMLRGAAWWRYVTDVKVANVREFRSWLRDGVPPEMGNPPRSTVEYWIARSEEWIRRWGLPLARRR